MTTSAPLTITGFTLLFGAAPRARVKRPSQRPDLDDVTEASEPPTAGTRLVESPEPMLSILPSIAERRAT